MEMSFEQRLLIEKAAGECPESQFELGRLHTFGLEGFSKDLEKALFWLKKAAAAGHKGSMGLLIGVLFEFDEESAQGRLFYKYIKKLAQDKDPMAMMDLGLIYCGAEGHFPLEKYPELGAYFDFNKGLEMICMAADITASKDADLIPPHYYKSASDLFSQKTESILEHILKGGPMPEVPKEAFELLDMELMLMIRAHSGAQKSSIHIRTVKQYDTRVSEIREKIERFYEAKLAFEQKKQEEQLEQKEKEEPINEAKEIYKRYGRLT
jgi:hypothetical protein